MDPLPSICMCGRGTRILWSGPLGPDSVPVLLVCGSYPEPGCDLRMPIPAESLSPVDGS